MKGAGFCLLYRGLLSQVSGVKFFEAFWWIFIFLFAVDKVPPNNYSDEDSDDSDSEQEQFDSKKAKMELDEYADVD